MSTKDKEDLMLKLKTEELNIKTEELRETSNSLLASNNALKSKTEELAKTHAEYRVLTYRHGSSTMYQM